MIERQVHGSADLRGEPFLRVAQTGAGGDSRNAVEKCGPALLQEGEEGLPIRQDRHQRP